MSKAVVRALVELGERKPLPTGGTIRMPISVSAEAIVLEMDEGLAPAVMLSLAAMSWWAREIRPLPAIGWPKTLRSWALV